MVELALLFNIWLIQSSVKKNCLLEFIYFGFSDKEENKDFQGYNNLFYP